VIMALRIVVTGGAAFIGSAIVRKLIAESGVEVINVDKLRRSDFRLLCQRS
jgi:nucleoside-diphosphate-sugar epimerase